MQIVSSIFFLFGVTLSAVQPQRRAEQHTDPMQLMEHASELVDKGQHEEALDELLWCFDYGAKENSAFVGVRISFLLGRITELGKKYPPALEALRERRGVAVDRAERTRGTQRYMLNLMELAALNHSLGENTANLELFDEIKSQQPGSPLLGFLRHLIADELVEAGRAEELREPFAYANHETDPTHLPSVLERAWPRDVASRHERSTSVRATTVYALDQARFEQELSSARDEAHRLELLRERWSDVVLAATHYHVVAEMPLYGSVRHWQSGWLATGLWSVQANGNLLEAHDSLTNATVLVKGDCKADISVSGGGLVHIYGNLESVVTVLGHSEVVVGGDVTPSGRIDGGGILRVFVGGNVEGHISNSSSSSIWINGDVTGVIHAGRPSTKVHVVGGFFGQVLPFDVASLVYLDVRGEMPSEIIAAVAGRGWLQFLASVGSSDVAPGLYPKSLTASALWVVHSEVR